MQQVSCGSLPPLLNRLSVSLRRLCVSQAVHQCILWAQLGSRLLCSVCGTINNLAARAFVGKYVSIPSLSGSGNVFTRYAVWPSFPSNTSHMHVNYTIGSIYESCPRRMSLILLFVSIGVACFTNGVRAQNHLRPTKTKIQLNKLSMA